MIPHAILGPELPVFLESSLLPYPKSSSCLCNTHDLPITECGPNNVICVSNNLKSPSPFSSA